MNKRPFIAAFFFLVAACSPKLPPASALSGAPVVTALVETPPAPAKTRDDAADDPAIWFNPADPAQSAVVGTIKGYGVEVYDLAGRRLHTYKTGDPNNVDLRDGFALQNGERITLVGWSDRSDNSIVLQRLDPKDRSLHPLTGGRIPTGLAEVYGFCLYHHAKKGAFYAIVNGKDGTIAQYVLEQDGAEGVRAALLRTLKLDTQPEGMVADDELGVLYLGEEGRGVWRVAAAPGEPGPPRLIPKSGADNPHIAFDVEGLSIFYGADGRGYLLASSQGNYSYALFERSGENKYLGSFTIGKGIADAVEETDGLDVCARNLGGPFARGMLVVQDGWNYDEKGRKTAQNFKYVPWEAVEKAVLRR